MSKSAQSAMLELWRPPEDSGEPVGCLATTFTFAPGLFDEQCLARFLEIDSEPNRENLAFLLERETRLGGVYAGVLVDHTQAGVEHSLRWDILPVRIQAAKQHAKVSLLVWARHIRIIVASANLTEPGYRTNQEVAGTVELTPKNADTDFLEGVVAFLRSLLSFVPGASAGTPEVGRAHEFLGRAERQVKNWELTRRRGSIRQKLVCTLPAAGSKQARSSIEEAVWACRGRGESPSRAQVASPFFDFEDESSRVTASLCKFMARGRERELRFCVPAIHDRDSKTPRLAAPKSLLLTPKSYNGSAEFMMLPQIDGDKNLRPWHAKMLALKSDTYSALMVGSSNFTSAGMGITLARNAEANLLTIVDRVEYGREAGDLKSVWPEMDAVVDPETAEWLGGLQNQEEEEQALACSPPAGFLSATYIAGSNRQIIVRLDPDRLPVDWRICSCGAQDLELLSASAWHERSEPTLVEIAWEPLQPPIKLLVTWADQQAFLPLNVKDSQELPPPAQLDRMTADDMLGILAAADPSAACRVWAKRQQAPKIFDEEMDSATPIDLDPLRRYDLQATFLHRVRRRARIFARLRENLQRPVWGVQALAWRLHGLIGVESLADRLVHEFTNTQGVGDEALLTLADFLIVLREVDYKSSDGSLSKADFDQAFRTFIGNLGNKLQWQVEVHRGSISEDVMQFWERVLEQCQER